MTSNQRTFGKSMWDAFGDTILDTIFKPYNFFYYFNGAKRRAVQAAKFWKEYEELDGLTSIVETNKLKAPSEKGTVLRIMKWVNTTYPSFVYYTHDKQETWNTPMTTIKALEERKAGVHTDVTIDCDDYAILLYSLCRVAGVAAERLRLCLMKTETEWHLNVMYIHNGKTPYAVEGTYYASRAERAFGVTPYMHLSHSKGYYYEHIKYLFNEQGCWRNNYQLLM